MNSSAASIWPAQGAFGTTSGVTQIQINDKARAARTGRPRRAIFHRHSWKVVDKKTSMKIAAAPARSAAVGQPRPQDSSSRPAGQGAFGFPDLQRALRIGPSPHQAHLSGFSHRPDCCWPVTKSSQIGRLEPPPLESTAAPTAQRPAGHIRLARQRRRVPIRHQGICGSCCAFATVGVMESAMLINDISATCRQFWSPAAGLQQRLQRRCDSHSTTSARRPEANRGRRGARTDMPYVQRYTAEEGACYGFSTIPADELVSSAPRNTTAGGDIKNAIFTRDAVHHSIARSPPLIIQRRHLHHQ